MSTEFDPPDAFFFLPDGTAARKLFVGPVGGVCRQYDAEDVVMMRAALCAAKDLLFVVLECAAPDAWDNGNSDGGYDEGRCFALNVINRASKALGATGFHPFPERVAAVGGEDLPSPKDLPPYDDPFSDDEEGPDKRDPDPPYEETA
jgi:hypothetical protein